PGSEILLAHSTGDVVAALGLSDNEIATLGRRARERVLDEHTSAHRAAELDRILNDAFASTSRGTMEEAV
ncbi:MAG: glycosyltransferase family 1 protein, partial [Mesorhizobium sp.]